MNTNIKTMSNETDKKPIQIKSKKDTFVRTPAPEKTIIKKAQTYPADNVKPKKEESLIDDDMEMFMRKKEKKSKKVKCSHSSIINEGGIDICVDCGETIQMETFDTEWRYYGDADSNKSYDPSRCQYRKVQDKGIKKDLEKLGFSREIIDKSDYYYQKVTQGDIKRSNLRKGIMFACVLYSHKYIKKHITSEELDKVFEIGRKNMSKG
jgi:RNA polymerase-binding transcription factor DksA